MQALGLPAGSGVIPMTNIDDRAIMLGVTDKDWRLYGLNVADGVQFMRPLTIGSTADADISCSVNRPPDVLCVWSSSDPAIPSRAIVIDTDSGDVVFDGPTQLRAAQESGSPRLEQIGEHAVATVADSGVYGVGPHAELTWFVPGDGILPTRFTETPRDTQLPALAIQGGGSANDVVFSVADGTIVQPALPGDVELGRAMVFPNGFGYEFTSRADFTKDRVAFFDSTGKKLSELEPDGTLEVGSPDLPMILTPRHEIVTTINGEQLLQLSRTFPSSEARLIGPRLFVSSESDGRWEQFDLRTGDAGKPCKGDDLGAYYVGSDGEVAVSIGESAVLQGIDLATCQVLWTLPPSGDAAVRVWRVGDTLVQRKGDELFSLVAPT